MFLLPLTLENSISIRRNPADIGFLGEASDQTQKAAFLHSFLFGHKRCKHTRATKQPSTATMDETNRGKSPRDDEIHRQQGPSLLEQMLPHNHSNSAEAKRAIRILENRSKFPKKLREAIQRAASAQMTALRGNGEPTTKIQPEIFLSKVKTAVDAFFDVDGRSALSSAHDESVSDNTWHGLNCDIDTEEEAETAFRFLWEDTTTSRSLVDIFCPDGIMLSIQAWCLRTTKLMKRPETVPFVPQCIKMAYGALDGHYNANDQISYILKTLLSRRTTREGSAYSTHKIFEKLYDETYKDLEEKSLLALMRLREEGLVRKYYRGGENNLLRDFIRGSTDAESSFFERRLKMFVQWNPSIFHKMEWGNKCPYTLYDLIVRNGELSRFEHFEIAFELGMAYHPMELGFIFYQTKAGSFPQRFWDACKAYGTKRISEMVRNKIMSRFESNSNKMREMMLAAATNDDISLDGLYTLMRLDPIALAPEAITSQRKEKRQRTM
jgi:hypothetical protein